MKFVRTLYLVGENKDHATYCDPFTEHTDAHSYMQDHNDEFPDNKWYVWSVSASYDDRYMEKVK